MGIADTYTNHTSAPACTRTSTSLSPTPAPSHTNTQHLHATEPLPCAHLCFYPHVLPRTPAHMGTALRRAHTLWILPETHSPSNPIHSCLGILTQTKAFTPQKLRHVLQTTLSPLCPLLNPSLSTTLSSRISVLSASCYLFYSSQHISRHTRSF